MNKLKVLSIVYIFIGVLFYSVSIFVMLNHPASEQNLEGNLKIVNYVQNINVDLNTIRIHGSKHFELVLMPFLIGSVFFLTGNIKLFFDKKQG